MARILSKDEKLVNLSIADDSGITSIESISQQCHNDQQAVGRYIRDHLVAHPNSRLIGYVANPGPSNPASIRQASMPDGPINLKMLVFQPQHADEAINLVAGGARVLLSTKIEDQYDRHGAHKPHPRLVLTDWLVRDGESATGQHVNLVLHPKDGSAHVGKPVR